MSSHVDQFQSVDRLSKSVTAIFWADFSDFTSMTLYEDQMNPSCAIILLSELVDEGMKVLKYCDTSSPVKTYFNSLNDSID